MKCILVNLDNSFAVLGKTSLKLFPLMFMLQVRVGSEVLMQTHPQVGTSNLVSYHYFLLQV